MACHNIRNGDKIQQSTAKIFGHSACDEEIDGEITASINEKKIAENMRWDGLHGVVSNKLFKEVEAYDKYKRPRVK